MSDMRDSNEKDSDAKQEKRSKPVIGWGLLLFIGLALSIALYINWVQAPSKISLSYLENLIEGKDFNGNEMKDENGRLIGPHIDRITIVGEEAIGVFKVIPPAEPTYDANGNLVPDTKPLKKQFTVQIPSPNSQAGAALYDRLRSKNINVSKEPLPAYDITSIIILALMFTLPVLIMFYLMRRMQNQAMGGGSFLSSFSRSPAKRFEPSDKHVTFADVAGLDNVKGDLVEIVEYLRNPSKYQRLGGQIPKGVLLFGPPGTGKTLMARAVAGEASVPFFSVNGSEFIQMFVGVGASRVRDLFASAKRQSPAIVFIDEIDAVGRQRGAGLGGGHDEREQTLNQILGEMDGFQKNESVIVLAATNRPDVLDPALLRPGRFDRHVMVSRPTQTGRLAIFKVHVRDVPLGPDVELEVMASATAGMTGADIENLVNEAALWAARHNKNYVEMTDFYYAHDKVLMGARREEILSDKEKRRTAFHEAGHTMAAWFLSGAYPVHKVTVIPRGHTLGVTQMTPLEDRLNMSENELRDQLIVALAGRAAEQLVYDELTVGAENDLEQATNIARRMVTHWGMSGRLGPVSFKMSDEDPFLGREIHKNRQFSEHTMEVIDDEVTIILQAAAKSAFQLLGDRREALDRLADELVKTEELDQKELEVILGPSVHKRDSNGQHK